VEVTATAWALRPHAVGFAEATAWSVFYVTVALAFGIVLALVMRAILIAAGAALRVAGCSPGVDGRRAVTPLYIVLAVTTVASLARSRSDPTARARSLRAHPARHEAEPPADRLARTGT
jgi:hypothetical protein